MSIHEPVDIQRWLDMYPLEAFLEKGRADNLPDFRLYPPSDIDSPRSVTHTFQWRTLAGIPGSHSTAPTPVDVLVPALGEPPTRPVSKIAGVPYWPKDRPWPRDSNDDPMLFLAQFCLTDSLDVLPASLGTNRPGDVLLIFVEDCDDLIWSETEGAALHFEWLPLGLEPSSLIQHNPSDRSPADATFFQRHRSTDTLDRVSLTHKGVAVEVGGAWRASKIGGLPVWQQSEEEADEMGDYFASLHSINPAGETFPFLNVPIPSWGPLPYSQNFLMLGDVGTLYLFWDHGRVRWLMQCG